MRNSIKKTLAAVSAATMVFASVAASAMSASAADAVSLKLDQTIANPGDTVAFNLTVSDNAEFGFAGTGFVFNYDSALTIGLDEDDELLGDVGLGFTAGTAIDTDACVFSVALASQKVIKKDGVVFTCYFTVPEDAAPGTIYPITMTVNAFNDDAATAVPYTAVDGWIQVAEPTTTTTTEETTTTTTTSTTVTDATTTTSAAPVTVPNTGSENTASALGLAGLLTAAAAAVVLKKKKD